MKEKKIKRNHGITLIALVVTIIVLLILAGITINLAFNSNGILNRAGQAKEASRAGVIKDETAMWKINNEIINKTNKEGVVELTDFTQDLLNRKLITQAEKDTIDKEKKIEIGGTVIDFNVTTIIVDGQAVTLTRDNFGQYLGMQVEYHPQTPHTDYGTSTIYRLFYVDYDNKYGDGAGTIYLKADSDCAKGKKSFSDLGQTEHSMTDTSRMAKHNPLWANSNDDQQDINKKCVSFMMDEEEWKTWIDNSTYGLNKVNYVVGGPSLEIFVDSYNAMHGKGDTPGTGATKLCCKYDGAPGYKVGINNNDYTNNSGLSTAGNTLKPDIKGRKMLNPGSNEYYWLASPSAYSASCVMFVDGRGSYVNYSNCYGYRAFCPLVSLKSDVQLIGLPD